MIGPVGACIAALSAVTVVATWNSRDRTVAVLAWYVALNAALSLLIHSVVKEASGRASPLMLMDAAGLYGMGLVAVCRTSGARWLNVLIAATGLQCAAHIAYVADLIPGNAHTLALNILFLVQVGSLMAARSAPPEDDLNAPLPGEALG